MNSKTNGSPVTVVLVNPSGIGRDGLKSLFHSRGNARVVGEARDMATAAGIVRESSPDVVLIDTDAFSEPPLQAIYQLSHSLPDARILLLCRESEVCRMSDLADLFAGGVKGVVLKDENSAVLLSAIDRVHAGEVWIGRRTIARVLENSKAEKSVRTFAGLKKLSARERDVIVLVSNGCRNKRVAEALRISEATVRNHLTSIFRKMRIKDRIELALFVNRHGLSRSALKASHAWDATTADDAPPKAALENGGKLYRTTQ